MTFVIDASVAAKWLVDEADSESAYRYLVEDLIAPPLLRSECANAIVKRLRLGQLDRLTARLLMQEIDMFPIRFEPVDEAETWSLAVQLAHPVSDCAYLVLARRRGLQVVTADKGLLSAARRGGLEARVRPMILADQP